MLAGRSSRRQALCCSLRETPPTDCFAGGLRPKAEAEGEEEITAHPTPPQCSLTGTWVNEVGSRMVVSSIGGDGRFTGSFQDTVSATNNTIQTSPVFGVQHKSAQPVFGFTVNWKFAESTTVFVGQCFLAADGKEQLQTTWLQRDKEGSLANGLKATWVGTNTFYRSS
ncbi:avidin-like [Python bivittatus]|uniref:Avidin-like n=1 Tax=Python bivittatus TaxID=176946 RepID=A0A9F5IX18_PYTBI|nr:avidin-like [Python bivittatus]